MSGLFDQFLPTSVHTLAFASSTLAKVAHDMANGHLHDHLLLHGGPGCGKSHLAGLIVRNRYPQLSLKARTYEGGDWDGSKLNQIIGTINADAMNGISQHYTIIEEADQVSVSHRQRLQAFMATFPQMKFIMTTNDPTHLSGALLNRANPFLMAMMPAAAAVPIVQQAAASLGKSASASDVHKMLAASNGSWRSLERYVRAF